MLFTIENSIIVVIDVQGELANLVHEKDKLFKNIKSLIKASQLLKVPCIYTEQVPEKIGPTISLIKNDLLDATAITKVTFSCYLEEKFRAELKKLKRKQIIICGIEAHVCVFQTVADLIEKGFSVGVVSDAVSSRQLEDKNVALTRMASLGVEMLTLQMIVTELMRTSKHEKFREVLALIK